MRRPRASAPSMRATAGASSVMAALVASGLPTHAFCFAGFLPRTSNARRKFFARYAESDTTLVVFESPYRVLAALKDLVASLGPDRPLAVGRELTKYFEEVFRGTAAAALEYFEQHPPRGEFTFVIGGARWADWSTPTPISWTPRSIATATATCRSSP